MPDLTRAEHPSELQIRPAFEAARELYRRAALCEEHGQFDRANSLRARADELLDERTPEVLHEDTSPQDWCKIIAIVLGAYAICGGGLAGSIKFLHWLFQR
jgi:hypothetical protein